MGYELHASLRAVYGSCWWCCWSELSVVASERDKAKGGHDEDGAESAGLAGGGVGVTKWCLF